MALIAVEMKVKILVYGFFDMAYIYSYRNQIGYMCH